MEKSIPGPSSSSSRSIGNSPSSEVALSGASTQVEEDREATKYNDEKRSNDSDDKNKEYEERGIVEIEEDGEKRKVMLVVEQKSGKEMFRDVGGGPYTQPRWLVTLLLTIIVPVPSDTCVDCGLGVIHFPLSSPSIRLRQHHSH